ncbi:MAG: winged helix-turn-helix domain-containing protein [Terriglobales bacterium]
MRVLVGRADRRSARFVRRALREDACAVDVVGVASTMLKMCDGAVYAALVLHADLAGLRGPAALELCRQLRLRMPHAPLLLLSPPGLLTAEAAQLAGATALLAEPIALADLRLRLRVLIRHASRSASLAFTSVGGALHWGGLTLDPSTRCARRDRREFPLTRREYALLELLLLRAPRPVSHADIVAHVWDGDPDGGSNLVEVYVARLRKRIDAAGDCKLLHTVRGTGYRLGAAEA